MWNYCTLYPKYIRYKRSTLCTNGSKSICRNIDVSLIVYTLKQCKELNQYVTQFCISLWCFKRSGIYYLP